MNTKSVVRLIKNRQHKEPEVPSKVELTADSNKWSAAVRSWVVESQQNRRGELLPAFGSLFNDALLK